MQTSSASSATRSSSAYNIKSGDTLWAIASRLQKQGVQGGHWDIIRRIQALNPKITDPNRIMAGDNIRLPVAGASDGFTPSPTKPPKGGGNSGGNTAPVDGPSVTVPEGGGSKADAYRARVAQWAIKQADDPNIGYSQTKGRMGNKTDANGHRYFDCSGLVYSAYKQAGTTLGGDWTGAMRSTWSQWADQVPKKLSAMKPGDLILMNGHVVMYTGNGKCVGAQTSHTAFKDQVTTGIDASKYLGRSDAIVLRPHVPASLLD